MFFYHTKSQAGFSIIMALGTIGILLIIVVGLASAYIREGKLSRTTYNDIIATAGAEGVFEYGMLKIRNHREGFEDTVFSSDPDGAMFVPVTDRSRGLNLSYTMKSKSSDETFSLLPNEHLIIPLFVAKSTTIFGAELSHDPRLDLSVEKTKNLVVQGLQDLTWTIAAQNETGSTVGIVGTGDILEQTQGIFRHQDRQCYESHGDRIKCDMTETDEIAYLWDESMLLSDFLDASTTIDPYLLIYNTDTHTREIHMVSDTPFSLPSVTIETTARKGDSSQIFRFSENKSGYYDALKYGIYNQ